ncbi:paramyosin-like [Centroberyx affinis]|uniref:paramyosin-like n=1 Tax=Centroberyx affinis TaxID=166261 RepID=UPI003A5C5BA2
MNAFPAHMLPLQHSNFEEQIKRLQHAIDEKTAKLEEVKQERQRAEEDTIQCTKERERRVVLMMESSEVSDVLQQLGHLLQEENHLSEQLNAQVYAVRNQSIDLQEMEECVAQKARSLTTQISEVKQSLADAKGRCLAAQALIHAPTSKPKRNQSKHK